MISEIEATFEMLDGTFKKYSGMETSRVCKINFYIAHNKCTISKFNKNIKNISIIKFKGNIIINDNVNYDGKIVEFSI